MITSTPYYTGNIEIPNISTDNVPNASRVGKNTKLKQFIEEYEVDALSKGLGFSLCTEFKAQLEVAENATTETVKTDADQKWKDLFSGKTYTKDGMYVRYRGLIYTEGKVKKSPLAYYVFKHFFENDMTHYGGIGLQIEEAKKSKRADYRPKFVLAHQMFYELMVGTKSNPKESAGYRSMYQFIQDMNDENPDTYPNWMPYCFPKLNIMGI